MEIPGMLRNDGKVFRRSPKKQILTVVLQNCEKSAVEYSIGKPMLLNMLDLSIIYCPTLY